MRGSRRHFGRTLTCSSRNTRTADERLHLRSRPRADLAHHRALLPDEDSLLGLGLDVDSARTRRSSISSTSTVIACGTSSRVSWSAFSRMTSAIRSSSARSVACSPGKYAGPSGSSETRSPRSSPTPSFVFALTGCRAWKSPSAAAAFICDRDVRGLEPVDLVERDHDRLPEPEHAPRDEAVARADVRARVDDEQDGVDVVEGRVDRLLHALGERVDRTLEPGKVDERELVVGAVRDAEDPPARRVRDVRGDRDLLAAERVDERGLADVRAAGNGDETATSRRSRSCRTTPEAARRASSSRPARRCGTRRARRPSRAATGGTRRTEMP